MVVSSFLSKAERGSWRGCQIQSLKPHDFLASIGSVILSVTGVCSLLMALFVPSYFKVKSPGSYWGKLISPTYIYKYEDEKGETIQVDSFLKATTK